MCSDKSDGVQAGTVQWWTACRWQFQLDEVWMHVSLHPHNVTFVCLNTHPLHLLQAVAQQQYKKVLVNAKMSGENWQHVANRVLNLHNATGQWP